MKTVGEVWQEAKLKKEANNNPSSRNFGKKEFEGVTLKGNDILTYEAIVEGFLKMKKMGYLKKGS